MTRLDMLDYPTAFAILNDVGSDAASHLSPSCSAVQTAGALLCDCGAVAAEWGRRGAPGWRQHVPMGLRDAADVAFARP